MRTLFWLAVGIAKLAATYAAVVIGLSVLWLGPPVVWWSVAHDVPFRTAVEVAAQMANGPDTAGVYPIVDGTMGGLVIFDVVAWLAVLAPLYLAVRLFMVWDDRRLLREAYAAIDARKAAQPEG